MNFQSEGRDWLTTYLNNFDVNPNLYSSKYKKWLRNFAQRLWLDLFKFVISLHSLNLFRYWKVLVVQTSVYLALCPVNSFNPLVGLMRWIVRMGQGCTRWSCGQHLQLIQYYSTCLGDIWKDSWQPQWRSLLKRCSGLSKKYLRKHWWYRGG